MSYGIRKLFVKYRSAFLVGAFSILLLIFMAASGIGYVAYKMYSSISNNTVNMSTSQSVTLPEWSKQVSSSDGLFAQLIYEATHTWIQQQAASGDLHAVQSGLSCVQALGGPSPQDVVSRVDSMIADEAVRGKLQSLVGQLDANSARRGGLASCSEWLLRS